MVIFPFFSFEKNNGIIKQIMTGPSGNRLSICPERFRIASPRVSIDRGAAEVNTLETSHYLLNIAIGHLPNVAIPLPSILSLVLTHDKQLAISVACI